MKQAMIVALVFAAIILSASAGGDNDCDPINLCVLEDINGSDPACGRACHPGHHAVCVLGIRIGCSLPAVCICVADK
ncbi:hypothetical protein AAVH_17302 [Aphelenchoides avenae]|nr:hypothetical protein AAVH_17302 [Aphelenchus avenae]